MHDRGDRTSARCWSCIYQVPDDTASERAVGRLVRALTTEDTMRIARPVHEPFAHSSEHRLAVTVSLQRIYLTPRPPAPPRRANSLAVASALRRAGRNTRTARTTSLQLAIAVLSTVVGLLTSSHERATRPSAVADRGVESMAACCSNRGWCVTCKAWQVLR